MSLKFITSEVKRLSKFISFGYEYVDCGISWYMPKFLRTVHIGIKKIMTTFEQTPARGADKIGPMRKGSNGIRSSMDIVFTLTLLRWEKKL